MLFLLCILLLDLYWERNVYYLEYNLISIIFFFSSWDMDNPIIPNVYKTFLRPNLFDSNK